jgi:hypothetical protein
LVSIGCGAGEDLDANKNSLLEIIDKATGGQNSRLGAVCLYGDSNSCGLILLLAKALNGRGVNSLLYVGVADVTMMPDGRKPGLPGIGSLQPVNSPPISFGMKVFIPGVLLGRALPPSVSEGPPPRISDPGVVANRRENFFTAEGNRARVFKQSPAGADNWWWTSTMKHGEVHGELPGWTNIRKITQSSGTILARGGGSIDDGHHNALCGIAMAAMKAEVSLEMVKFATKL